MDNIYIELRKRILSILAQRFTPTPNVIKAYQASPTPTEPYIAIYCGDEEIVGRSSSEFIVNKRVRRDEAELTCRIIQGKGGKNLLLPIINDFKNEQYDEWQKLTDGNCIYGMNVLNVDAIIQTPNELGEKYEMESHFDFVLSICRTEDIATSAMVGVQMEGTIVKANGDELPPETSDMGDV